MDNDELAEQTKKGLEEEQRRIDILAGKVIPNEDDDLFLKKFEVSDNKRFILTTKGISMERKVYPKNEKDSSPDWGNSEKIFIGTYLPLEKLDIDGATLFKVRTLDEKVMNMKSIISTLKAEGGVVNKSSLDDAVNAISLELPIKKGHATYGVYEENGKMFLCFNIMPYKDKQIDTAQRCKIDCTISKERIEPYIDSIKFWHPYEILPAMGMSVMSPFALLFRREGKLVVIVWHFAPKSHLGKSTVQQIFSLNLFGIYPISGDNIKSSFRLLNIIDSICGYITVNEVDNVDWSKIDDLIKAYPENYITSSRGRADLSNIEFLSRGVLGLTSNRFKIKSSNTLTRIFKIEFDVTKEGERNLSENTDKIDEIKNKMEPIGWRIVEDEIEHYDRSLLKLIDEINSHGLELRNYVNYIDPRRGFSWGMCYEGLKAWERACKKFGVDWKAPSYEEFAKDVIKPIEATTKDTGKTPLADFVQWWEMWKAKHTKKMEYDGTEKNWISVVVGEDDIWARKTITYNDRDYAGDVITEAILREYSKDRDYQIDSLSDIANSVMSIIGVPKDKIYGSFDIGGSTKWAVFLPYNLFKYKAVKEELKEAKSRKNDDIDWSI